MDVRKIRVSFLLDAVGLSMVINAQITRSEKMTHFFPGIQRDDTRKDVQKKTCIQRGSFFSV